MRHDIKAGLHRADKAYLLLQSDLLQRGRSVNSVYCSAHTAFADAVVQLVLSSLPAAVTQDADCLKPRERSLAVKGSRNCRFEVDNNSNKFILTDALASTKLEHYFPLAQNKKLP